jgi:hypothetical protein
MEAQEKQKRARLLSTICFMPPLPRAHVELVASLGKLKQAADAEHEDHRVEMA